MPTKVKRSKKIAQKRRQQTSGITQLEDLSPEIFFDIFDHLTGNEIYKTFSNLNTYFDELIQNTPNIHLNLSRPQGKFYQLFQNIFPLERVTSIALLYDNVNLLDELSNTARLARLRSLTLLKVPLRAFESSIPSILGMLKDQLLQLKIEFNDMNFTKPGRDAARSLVFLLTELSRLKSLTLHYFDGIDSITYIPLNIVNRTIITLDITLRDQRRLIPLLYRFENLKTLLFRRQSLRLKRQGPSSDIEYYREQLHEKEMIDYPIPCRSIHVYDYAMAIDQMESLLQMIVSPTLVNLHLLTCQRPEVRNPMPRREPPFLDGPQWHSLIFKYLLGTMREFYIEYEDADNIMSIRSLLYVKNKFAQWNNLAPSWHVNCAYDKDRRYLSFTFRHQNL